MFKLLRAEKEEKNFLMSDLSIESNCGSYSVHVYHVLFSSKASAFTGSSLCQPGLVCSLVCAL